MNLKDIQEGMIVVGKKGDYYEELAGLIDEIHRDKELRQFEDSSFLFNRGESFSLNEKDEKIWSYLAKENGKETTVIFQMMLFGDELSISFTAEDYNEALRLKSSLIAHKIKRKFQKRPIKEDIRLENPIIQDLELYQNNLSKELVFSQQEKKVAALYQKIEDKSDKRDKTAESIFELYGEDGKNFGRLMEHLNIAHFTEKENGTHELKMNLSILCENEAIRNTFLEGIQNLGYGIAYVKSFDRSEEKNISELWQSGLLQID